MNGLSQNQRAKEQSITDGEANGVRHSDAAFAGRGKLVVVGVMALAIGLGAFAVWFQWEQTRRCLGFFGSDVAAVIQSAPTVELWDLASDGTRTWRTNTRDVTQAPGLVHLRRGLIEDVNYEWTLDDPQAVAPRSLPADAWDVAIAFLPVGPGNAPAVVLGFDLDVPGSLTVVGQPGRVRLGRLRAGLAKWVQATQASIISWEKSAY